MSSEATDQDNSNKNSKIKFHIENILKNLIEDEDSIDFINHENKDLSISLDNSFDDEHNDFILNNKVNLDSFNHKSFSNEIINTTINETQNTALNNLNNYNRQKENKYQTQKLNAPIIFDNISNNNYNHNINNRASRTSKTYMNKNNLNFNLNSQNLNYNDNKNFLFFQNKFNTNSFYDHSQLNLTQSLNSSQLNASSNAINLVNPINNLNNINQNNTNNINNNNNNNNNNFFVRNQYPNYKTVCIPNTLTFNINNPSTK